MPSIQYHIINILFKVIGVKSMLDQQGKDFEDLLEKYRKIQKKPLKIPYNKMSDFSVEKRKIGDTVCYSVKVNGASPKKAVLYLFGGGYILPPDPGDLILCGQIAKNCDAQVWFPLYPMAPGHRLSETLASTCEVYKEMLKSFDSENIRFFGTSSGGGQALSLCVYIKDKNLNLPLPKKLVLQSPGLQVPPSDRQRQFMKKLAKKDVMIPPGFFNSIAPVLTDENDAYLLSPVLYDLSGFPAIDIFYGTNEVMIAYLQSMKKACKKYSVPLKIHIGKGMMHCWGAMEFIPEAKTVRREYFAALQ